MAFSYSSRIKWIKIILPILAIGVILLVLGMEWTDNSKIMGEFKPKDKVFEQNSVTVDKPLLDIATSSGDSYRLEAQKVQSIDGMAKRFYGGTVNGDMMIAGSNWKMSAGEGVANVENEKIEFSENVIGELDKIYMIESDKITADVKNQIVRSPQAVKVKSDSGFVQADQMKITGPQNAREFTFTGNVSGQFLVGEKK